MTSPAPVPIFLSPNRPSLVRWGVVVLSLALAVAWLATPAPDADRLTRAEIAGYRATRHAAMRRMLAQLALDSLHSAQRGTDAAHARAVARLKAEAQRAIDGLTPTTSTTMTPMTTDGDTLVPLPLVRVAIRHLADSAQALIDGLVAQQNRERNAARTAILRLQETLAYQDTVIAAKTDQIAALQHTQAGPLRRALAGMAHAGAGIACGATGWALMGPLAGLGAGAVCAAVAGMMR